MLTRACAALALAALAVFVPATAAHADPAFGPGNGQQNGDKCHPPGQTVTVPGCK